MGKQFGGKITKVDKVSYQKSNNWNKDKFVNLEETSMDMNLLDMPNLLYKQIFKKEGRTPSTQIPILPFDKEEFLKESDQLKFYWFGHSVFLFRLNNQTILIDPMLGADASPIAPFATKRFSDNTLDLIDDFPTIDLLLLTHDHYDHLDLESVKKLIPKVKKYYVALGCKRHLVEWGIEADLITEFDWWEDSNFNEIKITFTPSRHFSGRGLTDRAKSLWGGWVLKTDKENIYFSGDGGYGDHFKEIGEKLGPFDFGFMECGQYNKYWHQIHMYPEESIQAALDVGVKNVLPYHWAGFALSLHTWTDPVERFVKAAEENSLNCTIPELGELVYLSDLKDFKSWWLKYI